MLSVSVCVVGRRASASLTNPITIPLLPLSLSRVCVCQEAIDRFDGSLCVNRTQCVCVIVFDRGCLIPG